MANVYAGRALEKLAKKRHPEWEVVRRLTDALDDGYDVLHNRVFTVAEPPDDRREPTMELDVLVMHPDRGILIIEVKGGVISCSNGRLYKGAKVLDPQPHKQVLKQQNALIDHLRASAPGIVPGDAWRPFVKWAIAFPTGADGDREPFIKTVSGRARDRILWPEVFLGGAQDALREAVERAFGAEALRPDLRGRRDWQEHVRTCTSDSDWLPELLSTRLRFVDKELDRLTKAQAAILNQDGEATRMLVTGPAGSGKTVLAWEKAARLARAGRKVLLVSYDPRALDAVEVPSAMPNITARTVEQLCREIAGDEIDNSDFEQHDPYWFGRSLPDALEVAAARLADDQRFDDLIVDEVFDMWPRILGALRGLLREEATACVWLFGDARQGVTWRAALELAPEAAHEWSDIPPFATFREGDLWGDGSSFQVQRLSLNCRNTQRIQSVLAGRFFRDGSSTLYSEEAPRSRPRVESWTTTADLRSKVVEAVGALMSEGVDASDIAVLHGIDARLSDLYDFAADRRATPSIGVELPEAVEVSSVATFKGGDRQAIVLCEMEGREGKPDGADGPVRSASVAATRAQAHWYTALSRARAHLVILVRVDESEQPPKLNSVLEQARKRAGEQAAGLARFGLSVDDIWPLGR